MLITQQYLLFNLLSFFQKFLIGLAFALMIQLDQIGNWIQPYLFDRQFAEILSLLLIGDIVIGAIKHIRLGDFTTKDLFIKFVLKLIIVTIATITSKAIISIEYVGELPFLVVAVKLTIALYLFGNINKNICNITDDKLCFTALITSLTDFIKKNTNDNRPQK